MTTTCKSCGREHPDTYAAYCRRCRSAVLAEFLRSGRVRTLPAPDDDRPVRRMEVQRA